MDARFAQRDRAMFGGRVKEPLQILLGRRSKSPPYQTKEVFNILTERLVVLANKECDNLSLMEGNNLPFMTMLTF